MFWSTINQATQNLSRPSTVLHCPVEVGLDTYRNVVLGLKDSSTSETMHYPGRTSSGQFDAHQYLLPIHKKVSCKDTWTRPCPPTLWHRRQWNCMHSTWPFYMNEKSLLQHFLLVMQCRYLPYLHAQLHNPWAGRHATRTCLPQEQGLFRPCSKSSKVCCSQAKSLLSSGVSSPV